jgi:hypothetical protein
MRFMAMIKATKDYESGLPPKPELIAAMGKLAEEERKIGIFEMGGGLLPSAQGHKDHDDWQQGHGHRRTVCRD